MARSLVDTNILIYSRDLNEPVNTDPAQIAQRVEQNNPSLEHIDEFATAVA